MLIYHTFYDIISLKEERLKTVQEHLSNFESQFKRSTIPLLILQLLSEKEMYAYEMIQTTLRLSNGVYKMPLLYTSLNKLQEQGYIIESRQEISKDNRVRIYYSITSKGITYLDELKIAYKNLSTAVAKLIYKKEL